MNLFVLITIVSIAFIQNAYLLPTNVMNKNHDYNAEEISGQFEGDIILTLEQSLAMVQRTGLISKTYRWQNNIIPYEIDSIFSPTNIISIHNAFSSISEVTCIKFRPRTIGDLDYVYVTGENTGCWSYVGKLGGKQILNLQVNGCLSKGTIMHEFIHAIGFYHMQSATERDDYVTIKWENIERGKEHNFNKYSTTQITQFNIIYDYESLMHYGAGYFSSNGQPTIVPLDSTAVIGQRIKISAKDIGRINSMYNC